MTQFTISARSGFLVVALWILLAGHAFAQMGNNFVNNVTAVPVPAVGHDYLKDLNEIVNPANGSVSVRIEAPRPEERGFNYPFYSFMYDSTQQFGIAYQQSTGSSYNCGPDTAGDGVTGQPPQPLTCINSVSFIYRTLSYNTSGYPAVLSGPNSLISAPGTYSRLYNSSTYKTCNLTQGYSYEDPYGVIHDLGVYSITQGQNANTSNCSYLGISDGPVGGDEQYKLVLYDMPSGISFPQNGTLTNSGSGIMIDTHGNGVQISTNGSLTPALEDTNGNAINSTGRSGTYQSFQPWGDALANPKTASRTFAGGATYQYTWGTTTTHFNITSADETKVQLGYDNLCGGTGAPKFGTLANNSNPVVLTMQEPGGLYYTFTYDATYGLLNKITYPTGAWVQYTWGVNSLSDATGWTTPAAGVNFYNDPIHFVSGSMNTSCIFRHDTPAITKRVVSYDGVHPALEQDFSYSTTWSGPGSGSWTAKQTTVTTKDLISVGTPSYVTIYNYSPWPVYHSIGSHLLSSPMALENTITYKDTHGTVLKTVTKAWNSYIQLSAECTTIPSGKVTGKFYQYQPYPMPAGLDAGITPGAATTESLTDVAEYDYGTVTTACTKPTTTPTRETVTTYASFANTALWPSWTYINGVSRSSFPMPSIADRPATVITYQNGTKSSETDYSYDQTTAVAVSPAPIGHDQTNYASGTIPRGNPTTVTRKCFQGSTACTDSITHIAYDATGQAVSVTDANNNQTTLSYADNYTTDDGSPAGNTNTYLTKITRPVTNGVSHVENFQWDFNKGQLRTLTDENLQPTSYQYADPWWRLTQATFPDGGSVSRIYQDAGPNPSVTTNTAVTSAVTMSTKTVMDAAGHVTQTQLLTDPEGTDFVDTIYDGLGRVYSISNPYRTTSDPTYGVTTYGYDSLNRKTVQIQPDGSGLQWCYNNIASTGQTNCAANASSQANTSWIDFSDEVGNHWQDAFDGLARMTAVVEPNGATTSPSMETDYTYDGLDNLLTVNQKGSAPTDSSQWRTRTFAYDSLSRLLTVINPESGAITYSYDPNGNLLSKIAPQPNQTGAVTVTTTYSYDALNRITQKTYSDGSTPTVFFTYDAPSSWGVTQTNMVGRRSEEWTGTPCCGTTAEIFGYDPMGRVIMNEQFTANMGYHPVNYTYDLAGDLTSGSNGEGFTISYGYDAAQRPTQVTSNLVDSQHPPTLFTADSSVGYFPAGQLRKGTFGNGLVQTNVYNNRLQPCLLDLVNSSSVTLQTCNDSTPSGNVLDLWMGYGATTNNGNVLNWNATGVQSFIRTYSYDTLNRISIMSDTVSSQNCKGLQWTYDAWGNRVGQATTNGSCFSFNNAATTQNRLTGYQYDAAGNLTNDGNHSYMYDAENRIITVDGGATSYVYDAEGRRAEKSGWSDYIHDLSGRTVAQVDPNGWQVGYIYFGGSLLAQYDNSTTHFANSDHLGSTRLLTSLNGSVYDSLDYQPFGEQISGDTGTTHKFTGKERDTESGLDYFGARYYGSGMGRFMSPDWDSKPEAVPYADLATPQSLNLYSYVLNNPLSKVDLNGHDWFNVDHKWQWQQGHVYHDARGKATKAKGYAGLLVATATGTNKQGATTYNLTLYDQNKVVATGTGFSGNNNFAETGAIKNGNYQILGRFDAPPTEPNPASADNNPPPVYGYQKIDPSLNSYANAVYQAYGPMRARLNPLDPSNRDGVYFHGQFGDAFHSEGWTHGCLSYGRDTTMINYMAGHFGNAWTGVSVNTPVVKP